MKEHLPAEEEKYLKNSVKPETLPKDGIIEVWTQATGSAEYIVTEYQKLQ